MRSLNLLPLRFLLLTQPTASQNVNKRWTKVSMARWPSGLRRQTKETSTFDVHRYLVRKGVGSNPTLVTLFASLAMFMMVKVSMFPLGVGA